MEIGINMYCRNLEIDRQIEYMKKYGFTTTFFDSDNPKAEEIMKKLNKAGIKAESLHAPFSKINSMWEKGKEGEEFLGKLMEGVEKCAKWGVPVLVVHISSGYPAPMVNDLGVERFDKLVDLANENGVKIAYENQRMLGNISLFMEHYPEAVFCWDTGHEGCFTKGLEYMPLFGNRLSELHINDNMKNYNEDLHMLPYDGKIDFEKVAQQIAVTDYTGSILLEVNGKSKYYDSITDDEYYAAAAKAAKRLADRIEGIREV